MQSIPRNTASKLNALIGFGPRETLENCNSVILDLGYTITAAGHGGVEFHIENLFRLFQVVADALAYELAQIGKEENHV